MRRGSGGSGSIGLAAPSCARGSHVPDATPLASCATYPPTRRLQWSAFFIIVLPGSLQRCRSRRSGRARPCPTGMIIPELCSHTPWNKCLAVDACSALSSINDACSCSTSGTRPSRRRRLRRRPHLSFRDRRLLPAPSAKSIASCRSSANTSRALLSTPCLRAYWAQCDTSALCP